MDDDICQCTKVTACRNQCLSYLATELQQTVELYVQEQLRKVVLYDLSLRLDSYLELRRRWVERQNEPADPLQQPPEPDANRGSSGNR